MSTGDRSTRGKGQKEPAGTGGFLGQVSLFETANGLPHGPMAIGLAIAAALVIYPLTWLARRITRR